jgi:hypothetical protein
VLKGHKKSKSELAGQRMYQLAKAIQNKKQKAQETLNPKLKVAAKRKIIFHLKSKSQTS